MEKELADLKRRLPSSADRKPGGERITGTLKDDPDVEELVRLGREFRKPVPSTGVLETAFLGGTLIVLSSESL